MSLPPLTELLLFMSLTLVACVYGVAVAGHFPAEHRATRFTGVTGMAVLWGTILLVAGSALVALYFAIRVLPWYAAVIGGGFMALAAPFLCLPFPDRMVNSRTILVILAAAALALDAAALQALRQG